MSEELRQDLGEPTAEQTFRPSAAAEVTGHPAVDDVLRSLDGLDGLPPADRVPVIEAAHDRLRSALADAGNEQPTG